MEASCNTTTATHIDIDMCAEDSFLIYGDESHVTYKFLSTILAPCDTPSRILVIGEEWVKSVKEEGHDVFTLLLANSVEEREGSLAAMCASIQDYALAHRLGATIAKNWRALMLCLQYDLNNGPPGALIEGLLARHGLDGFPDALQKAIYTLDMEREAVLIGETLARLRKEALKGAWNCTKTINGVRAIPYVGPVGRTELDNLHAAEASGDSRINLIVIWKRLSPDAYEIIAHSYDEHIFMALHGSPKLRGANIGHIDFISDTQARLVCNTDKIGDLIVV